MHLPGFKRVVYDLPPDLEEPLGTKISKKWGRKMYHGVLIEKFDGGDKEGDLYRGIYQDGEVSFFGRVRFLYMRYHLKMESKLWNI